MNVRKIIADAYREWQGKPFGWDGACCLAWVGDCARRITGVDKTVDLRSRYTSEMECKRGMVEEGWRSYGDAAASLYAEIPVSMAQSGDWAFCVDPDGNAGLGVVCGPMIAIRTQTGMGQVPLGWAQRAFRVE